MAFIQCNETFVLLVPRPRDEIRRTLIFLPLGKKELCAAKGCKETFGDPKGCPYNCVVFRLHVPNSFASVPGFSISIGVNNWIISVSLGIILLALKA